MATTYGFVTVAEADTYLSTRYGASRYWVSGADKESALTTAYNDLIDCDLFDLALDSGVATPQVFKDAQVEQALFIVQQDKALDARAGVQAQGVKQSQIVSETYEPLFKNGIAIAKRAVGALTDYKKYGKGFKYDSSDLTDAE